MDNEKELSGEESLNLIHSMIAEAQNRLNRDWFFFILWGWLVLLASLGCYGILKFYKPEYNGLPWAILMPIGGVVSGIYGWKIGKEKQVKTYADRMLDYISFGFMISLAIVLVFVSQSKEGWHLTYPLVMMVYGTWLFLSGGALRFRPLIIGGCINWALCISAFFVHTIEQVLILSLAVLLGYLVPGYMLRAAYHRQEKNKS